MIIIYLLLNVVSFLLFFYDKRCAIQHKWRVPEVTLLSFSLIGGFGALFSMIIFRHKINKLKFQILIPIILIIQTILLITIF